MAGYQRSEDGRVELQLLNAIEYLIANGFSLSGVTPTVNVDMVQADVEGITGGNAGAPGTGGKTLKDLFDALGGSVAAGAVDSKTVGATTTQLVAAAASRLRVVVTNLGTERVDVAIGAAAESGKGLPIQPLEARVIDRGAALAINAICASGGMSVAIQTLSKA